MVFKHLARALVAALATLAVTVAGDPGPSDYKILTISEFSSSFETQTLITLGYTVTQVSKDDFTTMTPTDFGRYNAIFIPDTGVCNDKNTLDFIGYNPTVYNNLATAVTGRMFVVGMSLSWERDLRERLPPADLDQVQAFLAEATVHLVTTPAVALWLSVGCAYINVDGPAEQVMALRGFGDFRARTPYEDNLGGCPGNVFYHAGAQALFPDVPERDLQRWQCPASGSFPVYPLVPNVLDYVIYDLEAGTSPSDRIPSLIGREMIAPACGNARVDLAFGEECDLGTLLNGRDDTVCTSDCKCVMGLSSNVEYAPCNPLPCPYGASPQTGQCLPFNKCGDECGSDLCDSDCKCKYGFDAEIAKCKSSSTTATSTQGTDTATTLCDSTGGCETSTSQTTKPTTASTSSPVSPTSSLSPSSPSSPSSGAPTKPTSSGAPETQSTSPATPTSTPSNDRLPPRVDQYVFKACTGSIENYPSFRHQFYSDRMILELCIAGCAGSLYAGTHVMDCYCSNTYDDIVEVAKDRCNVPCPGNPRESCGGFRSNTTEGLGRRRDAGSDLVRRQGGPVPANALLAIYIFAPVNPTASSGQNGGGTAGTGGVTDTAVLTAGATAGANGVVGVTNTVVATAASTVTAGGEDGFGPHGAGIFGPDGLAACATGFCHARGYLFELCHGDFRPGEALFVLKACSCAGGARYVPAGCGDAASCGSLAVYRAVPFTGDNGNEGAGNVTVYQPQVCTSCTGGVTFEQSNQTETAVVTGGSGGGGSEQTNATGVVVVVAGTSRLATYLSSFVVFIVGFLLL